MSTSHTLPPNMLANLLVLSMATSTFVAPIVRVSRAEAERLFPGPAEAPKSRNPHLHADVLKTLCQFGLIRARIIANPYQAKAGRVQKPKPAKINKRAARVQRRVKLFNLTGRHLSEKDARAIVARHIPNDALVGTRHQSANWQDVLAGAAEPEGKATIVIVRHESFPLLAEDEQFQMMTIDLGAV